MPPSSRRAAIRVVCPQRAQGFLFFGLRALQAWQTLPSGPCRGRSRPVRPQPEQAGTTTEEWPAAWSSRTTRMATAGQRGSPEVSASGCADRCSSRSRRAIPLLARAEARTASTFWISIPSKALLSAATTRVRRICRSSALSLSRVFTAPADGRLSCEPGAPGRRRRRPLC
jgi:hypothetical protein